MSKAIEGLLDDVIAVNNFQIDFRADSFYEEDISYEFKLSIFRIVQEQMNNIIKYSNAENVSIRLGRNEECIDLSIVDDGIGFLLSQPRKGIGLHNIMSRAELYNGNVDIQSEPGKGCCILINFPQENALLKEKA